ncbi:MAG: type II secretion system protein GspG [Kiritimatiellae bacterium]|nr:type II secretion system protein GspG [Kiritimatiellia bacterium]
MQRKITKSEIKSGAFRAAREGFTLIELLLVIAILGILATIVVPNIAGKPEEAKIAAARSSIGGIITAVQAYEVAVGKLPDSLDDLTVETDTRAALLSKSKLFDPWGSEYKFSKKTKFTFEVRSAGPDGQMGSEDDIYDTNGGN